MKFTNAVWETRNLGVECAEFEFSRTDTTRECELAFHEMMSYDYLTAKIPAGRMDIVSQLSSRRFRFAECLIELEHNLQNIKPEGIAARFDSMTSHELVDSSQVNDVFEEIRKGIFCTDRIYLDSHFSHQVAAERYVNWIKDEMLQGAEIYHVLYKDRKIGFFTYKEKEDRVAYPFLASLYQDYFNSGLGSSVVLEFMKLAKLKGCCKIDTFVSSNNPPILRIHETLGFRAKNIFYVMTLRR